MKRIFLNLFLVLCFGFPSLSTLYAQNKIEETDVEITAPPIELTHAQVEQWIHYNPYFLDIDREHLPDRVVCKLEQHIQEFLQHSPWRPFQHTLGISGYEVYFDHSDEMVYALSISYPFVSDSLAQQIKSFLQNSIKDHPPFAPIGFDRSLGKDRERYHVPEHLRLDGTGDAKSLFGIYAYWVYKQWIDDTPISKKHWQNIRKRVDPLLNEPYSFDIYKTDSQNDEAEILNGDLAGFLAVVRLARIRNEDDFAEKVLAKTKELLLLRVNLERVNADIIDPTHMASKSLHNNKLARFVDLTPEIAYALRLWTDGLTRERMETFREKRNGWYMAFGDRFIGGENYTNPLHFPRSVFASVVWIEQLPVNQLIQFLDIPWCSGDFYFMEKCAFTLMRHSSKS